MSVTYHRPSLKSVTQVALSSHDGKAVQLIENERHLLAGHRQTANQCIPRFYCRDGESDDHDTRFRDGSGPLGGAPGRRVRAGPSAARSTETVVMRPGAPGVGRQRPDHRAGQGAFPLRDPPPGYPPRDGLTASRSPPEVCASTQSSWSAGVRFFPQETWLAASRFRSVPPGTTPSAASSRARRREAAHRSRHRLRHHSH